MEINDVKIATDISDSLKNILLENKELIDIVNHFIEKEVSNNINSYTNLAVTTLSISYVVGGFINSKK